MGELAELFELMHGAPVSFRTLRAVIRDWGDYEPSRRARAELFEQADPEGWAAYVAEGGTADDGSWCDSEGWTRLWIDRADRIREEIEGWAGEVRVATDAGASPRPSAYADLLDPLVFAPALNLEIVGGETVAGRSGLCVRGEPREPDGVAEYFSPLRDSGADQAELVVDRERGFLLRKTCLLGDEPVETVEFTELELDAPLDAELFVPPSVDALPSVEEATVQRERVSSHLSIEEAAALVPFTLFVLPAVWPRAQMSIVGSSEGISVSYIDSEAEDGEYASLSLRESVFQQAVEPPAGSRCVDLDGVRAFAWVGGASLSGPRLRFARYLSFVRDGTEIELQANGLGRDEFFALARSLEPARRGRE
jgi:hypothetical protein